MARKPVLLPLVAVLALAGCTAPIGQESNTLPGTAPQTPYRPVFYDFTGEFLAGGVDAPQSFPFVVQAGAGEVAVSLTWTMTGAVLGFEVLDPDQAVVADGWAETEQSRFVATTHPPTPGDWSVVVNAERGVDIHFALNITVRAAEPYGPIAQTYSLLNSEFAEVNLILTADEAFDYDWSADGELYFNIHYHAPGGTERPVEFTGTSKIGNFTAPATEVYSLLLRNDGVLPVAVSVGVDGTYRLHSMSR